MTPKIKMASKMKTIHKNEDDIKNENNLKNKDNLDNKNDSILILLLKEVTIYKIITYNYSPNKLIRTPGAVSPQRAGSSRANSSNQPFEQYFHQNSQIFEKLVQALTQRADTKNQLLNYNFCQKVHEEQAPGIHIQMTVCPIF